MKWAECLCCHACYFAATGELKLNSQGNSTVHHSQFNELNVELQAQLVKERVGGVHLFHYHARNIGLLIFFCYRLPLALSLTLPLPATSRLLNTQHLNGLPNWVCCTILCAKDYTWIDRHEWPEIVERRKEYLQALREDFIP